jgi:hypothetical protein
VNLVYNYQATININYVSDIPWRVYMNSDGTYSFDYNILIYGASTVKARNNARVIDDWDLNSLASHSPRYVLTGDVDYNLADGVTISGVDTFKTSKSASDLTYSVEEPTKNTESTINVHITQDLSSFNVQYWDTDGNPIQPNSYYSTYDYNTNNYDSYTKQNIVAAIDDYVCTGYSYPYGDAVVTTIDDTTTDSDGNYTSIVVDIPEIVPGKSDTIRLTYKKVVKYHALKVYEKYEYADGTTEKTLTKVDTNVAEGASYEYTADCPEGYEIIGSDSYSGVVNEDTTLTFTYRKIPSYALKVYEEYQNSDGSSEKTVTVADTTVLRGYSYSYTANCPEGYSLVGSSSYSGTVSADTTLTFIYKKNKAATEPEEKPTETTKYTMKVYEKYEYADGTEEKTETLVDTTLDSGSSYEYILTISDDIKNLDDNIFKKRRYFWVFSHYLNNGMTNIDLTSIADDLNPRYVECIYACKVEILFYIIDNIDISLDINNHQFTFCFERFNILFRYTIHLEHADYNALNNIIKQDIITNKHDYKMSIADKTLTNEFDETIHLIRYKGTEYSLLDDMYKRINNPDYLKSRDLENGGELFIIKEGQEATMAKNTVLAKEPPRFIKYIDKNGYVCV